MLGQEAFADSANCASQRYASVPVPKHCTAHVFSVLWCGVALTSHQYRPWQESFFVDTAACACCRATNTFHDGPHVHAISDVVVSKSHQLANEQHRACCSVSSHIIPEWERVQSAPAPVRQLSPRSERIQGVTDSVISSDSF